jgi:hypothetical protein
MSLLAPTAELRLYWHHQAYALGKSAAAAGEDATPAYNLSGQLYVSTAHDSRPWGNLSVPNALVRGVFDAMAEPGIELPMTDGRLNAHITVFRSEEIEMLGGPDALRNDRGKPFRYTLGRLVDLTPAGWPEMAKCWVLRVHSPELQALRRSYGLSSLPKDGRYDLHITVAVRRKGVLARSETAKATAPA